MSTDEITLLRARLQEAEAVIRNLCLSQTPQEIKRARHSGAQMMVSIRELLDAKRFVPSGHSQRFTQGE